MFLTSDEHIILMDDRPNPMLKEEFEMLADTGIKTVYGQGLVDYRKILPAKDVYCWEELDNYVDMVLHFGYKLLCPNVNVLPNWYDDSWYYSRADHGIPNYLNPQVGYDFDELNQKLINRYGCANFQLIYSIPNDGEFADSSLYPTDKHPFDNSVIAKFVVDRQKLLERQFGEVWTSFHHNGSPPYLEPVYQNLQSSFPYSQHLSIQFTYFNQPPEVNMFNLVKAAQEKYGIRYIVGSQYCEGLRENTDFAIQNKLDFITSPVHRWHGSDRVVPWMSDAIRESLAKFSKSQS